MLGSCTKAQVGAAYLGFLLRLSPRICTGVLNKSRFAAQGYFQLPMYALAQVL